MGNWRTWYCRGGRGSGKTRTGAETLREWIISNEPGDWAVIAPTDGAARKVCMEGRRSGLIAAFGGWRSPLIDDYRKTDGTLTLWNGSRVIIDGADDGALRIQGENLSGAWCDEVGLWRDWDTAWNYSLRLAIRINPGLLIATGTPKIGHGLVKQLLSSPRVTCPPPMRMIDNIENLPDEQVRDFYDEFGNTRLARQELEGEFIEDIPGALWTLELIDRNRVDELPELDRVVVGVDPSGASDEATGANSIGIVVCGWSKFTGLGYVLADYTVNGGPETWAKKVCWVYQAMGANLVVAEKNFGGEMVRHTLHTANPNMPLKLVNASAGKAVRADPVALRYDQGRVKHLRTAGLAKLEDQMTSWVPGVSRESPDRMDALVWALTELMLGGGSAKQVAYRGSLTEPVLRVGDLVLVGERFIDKP